MRLAVCFASLLLLAAAPGRAVVVFESYTDRPAFEARLGSVQVIDAVSNPNVFAPAFRRG